MRRVVVALLWAGAASAGLWVDTATFQAAEGTVVEVSLKLSTDSLCVLQTAEGDRAAVSFSVTVQDTSGTPLLSDRWERQLAAPPDSSGHDVYFLDSSTLEMPPGEYVFVITARDRGSDRQYTITRPVRVPAYAAPGLMLSDMLLSGTRPQEDDEGQFLRGGVRIVPVPDRAFGAASPILYVYQEIYNLTPQSALTDSFSLTYRVTDRAGREVRSFRTGGCRGDGARVVRVSGLSLAGIPPGRYDLEARVEDPSTGLRTAISRDLHVVAPKGGAQPLVLSEEELQKSRDLLAYLVSSKERALFESLDDAGKSNFITRFWTVRDPDPTIPGNPYLEEMIRRYDHANQYFTAHDPGWRTDRGRVYIVYGPPKDLDRNVSNPATRDHEIWNYAIEGQGTFIFVDERGYGDFRLVHSTVRGELSNPEWEVLLNLIRDER
ncbi:GWxTD domain-containing protein [Candidatus Fermentibacteria bacterium]|nr:GWxTD domain-containing protein [Candidatus Fermentibacteria bacterium]